MSDNTTSGIRTCLWYDDNAEEAATFYTSLFDDATIHDISRKPDGSALVVLFELNGQRFMALNGGPDHKLSDAVSVYVSCPDQAEVDRLWAELTDGGTETQCGWLVDAYGLSWQIIPDELPTLLTDPDPAKADRAMRAMLEMKKIDIQAVRNAVAQA